MKCKLEFSDIKIEKIVSTLYVCQDCVLRLFNCSCITCKYWVGHPLALNTVSTRLGIESYSSITVFGFCHVFS